MVLRRTGGVSARHAVRLILTFDARLIGFEELGNNDAFETAVLELRLSQSGESFCWPWILYRFH